MRTECIRQLVARKGNHTEKIKLNTSSWRLGLVDTYSR